MIGVQTPNGLKHEAIYRTYDGSHLPELLEKELSNQDYWISFRDGTHVIGASSSRDHSGLWKAEFKILKPDGGELGHFSQLSVSGIMAFLDRFIVTVGFGGDLKIWSQAGEELFNQFLGYDYPTLVSDEQARLVILSSYESSFYNVTELDFGAPRNQLPD